MRKVISYSLWGNKKIYTYGAIENAVIAHDVYPGWKTNIVVHKDVHHDTIYRLTEVFDKVVIYEGDGSDYSGLFWRLDPMTYDDVDVCVFRDCDSRLEDREFQAVREWLKSDKQIHSMRDHFSHRNSIMAGLWGIKKQGPINVRFLYLLLNCYNYGKYGDDERAWSLIYGKVYQYVLTHNDKEKYSIYNSRKFPKHKPLKYGIYIGEIIKVE